MVAVESPAIPDGTRKMGLCPGWRQYGSVEIEVLLRFLNMLMQSSLGLSDIEQPESKSVIPSDSSGKTTFSLQDVS
jgi:hypothetical protein